MSTIVHLYRITLQQIKIILKTTKGRWGQRAANMSLLIDCTRLFTATHFPPGNLVSPIEMISPLEKQKKMTSFPWDLLWPATLSLRVIESLLFADGELELRSEHRLAAVQFSGQQSELERYWEGRLENCLFRSGLEESSFEDAAAAWLSKKRDSKYKESSSTYYMKLLF